jgi:hypothetical protein
LKPVAVIFLILGLLAAYSCQQKEAGSAPSADVYTLDLQMDRLPQTGVDPFRVTITLKKNSNFLSGQTLIKVVPKGTVSAITDNGNGTYSFTVTPSVTGTFPVSVSFAGITITRKAVVLDNNVTGSGQPMAIPGDYVNTDGYEDGATITPDGNYLFVQYGPFYFSGVANFSTICSSGSYSAGYDLNTCSGRTNSSLVFNSIGPYAAPFRPDFPSDAITGAGQLRHLPGLVQANVFNGIVAFPTVFYGFKRQADGTFAEPVKLAFNDSRGINGPFGLSFKLNGDGTAAFVVAWNNYFNDLGDDKPDIYAGTLTLGQSKSLGDVVYSGDSFSSITPAINPVSFSSHTGVQGNPHLFADGAGVVQSIWTDDEQVSHDLSVYRRTSGVFPAGTWVRDTLPSVINTAAEESQPFFDGSRLILRRGGNIVSHAYIPGGACGGTYTSNSCWGPEVILIGANGNTGIGEIATVGEPTVANYGGKKYLYFVYAEARANAGITAIVDYNLDVAFVEIP